MAFQFVCDTNAINEGELKKFEINKTKVLVIRTKNGIFATQAKCPHMNAPLAKGKIIDDAKIQCKFHRAEFDIQSGKVEQWACFPPGIQALNFIRGEKDLQTFAVKVEDNKIHVDTSLTAANSEEMAN